MVTPITRVPNEVVAPRAHISVETAESVPQPVPVATPIDTVRLSADARVHLLERQGQTPAQIAVSLDLSPQLVASYLGTTPLQLEALSSTK